MLLKEASLAATKEEESAHPLLRGAGNTAEGFEVHRATFLLHLLPRSLLSLFVKELLDQSYKIYQGINSINTNLMIVVH